MQALKRLVSRRNSMVTELVFNSGRILASKLTTSTKTPSQDKIKLVLYTKKNCPLCDEAKELIDDEYEDRFEIEEVDITKDKSLFRRFKFDIPVFYHDGRFLMQHRVDRKALDDLINQTQDS